MWDPHFDCEKSAKTPGIVDTDAFQVWRFLDFKDFGESDDFKEPQNGDVGRRWRFGQLNSEMSDLLTLS